MPEDDFGLECKRMTTTSGGSTQPIQFVERLRQEAAVETNGVHLGEPTKETQIIAIYGKGGIGKSNCK